MRHLATLALIAALGGVASSAWYSTPPAAACADPNVPPGVSAACLAAIGAINADPTCASFAASANTISSSYLVPPSAAACTNMTQCSANL